MIVLDTNVLSKLMRPPLSEASLIAPGVEAEAYHR